jgi:O-antigen ligase
MKQESLDILVAMGFPLEAFRFQPCCHNKTIIVDGKKVTGALFVGTGPFFYSNRERLAVVFLFLALSATNAPAETTNVKIMMDWVIASGCHFLPCWRTDGLAREAPVQSTWGSVGSGVSTKASCPMTSAPSR